MDFTMKKLNTLITLFITLSISHPVLSMEDEAHVYFSSHTKKNPVHRIQYLDLFYELRSPQTEEEWTSYHAIRIAEIQNRYCQGEEYNYKNPEEELESNYRFVFVDSSTEPPKVIGVIRVDLLDGTEAALRWVAIEGALQRNGHGTCMLVLAEKFAREQGKTLMRVPAEEDSRGFYERERLGYIPMDWPKGPHHPGEVSLGKWLK
jgi:N-acetylglutamate synthase-like GNAT family acetyltransferase